MRGDLKRTEAVSGGLSSEKSKTTHGPSSFAELSTGNEKPMIPSYRTFRFVVNIQDRCHHTRWPTPRALRASNLLLLLRPRDYVTGPLVV